MYKMYSTLVPDIRCQRCCQGGPIIQRIRTMSVRCDASVMVKSSTAVNAFIHSTQLVLYHCRNGARGYHHWNLAVSMRSIGYFSVDFNDGLGKRMSDHISRRIDTTLTQFYVVLTNTCNFYAILFGHGLSGGQGRPRDVCGRERTHCGALWTCADQCARALTAVLAPGQGYQIQNNPASDIRVRDDSMQLAYSFAKGMLKMKWRFVSCGDVWTGEHRYSTSNLRWPAIHEIKCA